MVELGTCCDRGAERHHDGKSSEREHSDNRPSYGLCRGEPREMKLAVPPLLPSLRRATRNRGHGDGGSVEPHPRHDERRHVALPQYGARVLRGRPEHQVQGGGEKQAEYQCFWPTKQLREIVPAIQHCRR